DRAEQDELLDAGETALLEHVRAHEQVRVPEAARCCSVRPDPAGERGQVEDDLRVRLAEEPRSPVLVREVVLGAARDDDVVSRRLEALDDVRAEETGAAGDEGPHDEETGARVGLSQSTRPSHRSSWPRSTRSRRRAWVNIVHVTKRGVWRGP